MTGTSGSRNRMTGNSGGWQQVSFDLPAFAGKQVEVAISYVTDPDSGGAGVFVDDTRVVIGGAATQACSRLAGVDRHLGARPVYRWSGAPAGGGVPPLNG